MPSPLAILIPIYAGATRLEFTGPYQLLVHSGACKTIVASMARKPINSKRLVSPSPRQAGRSLDRRPVDGNCDKDVVAAFG